MDLSVVVPTYRRPDMLGTLLGSLRAQEPDDVVFEVVVVDDGSGEETSAVLTEAAATWPALRWEALPANRGPAAARNRGVDLAQGRWILFLDDDMVAPPELVRTHAGWLAGGDAKLGVVGLVEWLPALEVTPFMRWLDSGDVQFDYATMTEGPVLPPRRAFYTCNVSLSRELFTASGGFDERFPYAAYEDTELALRLTTLGFHLDFRPSALAWHARSIRLADFLARMERVGEAAVLLRSVQPELAADVDLDGPRATGWRRLIRRAVIGAGPLAERSPLRDRYYQSRVNEAFCTGVERGRSAA